MPVSIVSPPRSCPAQLAAFFCSPVTYTWHFVLLMRSYEATEKPSPVFEINTLILWPCGSLCDSVDVCVCSIACLWGFNTCAVSVSVIFGVKGHLWCHVSSDRPVMRTMGQQQHMEQMAVTVSLRPPDTRHAFFQCILSDHTTNAVCLNKPEVVNLFAWSSL